jgi:hypothetical protein
MLGQNLYTVTKPPATKIIGHGIIAQGLDKLTRETNGALIVASGVSNSSCNDQFEYDRECNLLYKTINHCKRNNFLVQVPYMEILMKRRMNTRLCFQQVCMGKTKYFLNRL